MLESMAAPGATDHSGNTDTNKGLAGQEPDGGPLRGTSEPWAQSLVEEETEQNTQTPLHTHTRTNLSYIGGHILHFYPVCLGPVLQSQVGAKAVGAGKASTQAPLK